MKDGPIMTDGHSLNPAKYHYQVNIKGEITV